MTKDGQPLEDIFIGRKTFYALSGIWTHVPLITGWVWSPLHYQSNHAGYMANLDSEWELRGMTLRENQESIY